MSDPILDKENHLHSNVNELPAGDYGSQGVAPYDRTKVHWFRSTLMQVVIVGSVSFLAPGAYSALASTGAGGLADVSDGPERRRGVRDHSDHR
jgi:hypothetical protein